MLRSRVYYVSTIKNRNSTFVTLIDLQKAFNMVDRGLMEFLKTEWMAKFIKR